MDISIGDTPAKNWSAYNQAQCNEKALLLGLLADLCSRIDEPDYKFGRPRNPLADMVFCSAFKVYSTYSGRRFTSDMKVAHENGYISKIPSYNSIFHCLNREDLTPLLDGLITESSKPLADLDVDFAVDSSGFTTSEYAQWSEHMWGGKREGSKLRLWVKAHLMTGVKTNVVTSVKLTDGFASDMTQFESLVRRTAENFSIREVSADKAYSSRKNIDVVRDVGGVAFIPFRKNAIGKSRGSYSWADMYHYFMLNREEFMTHYHKRSNVESTFFMIKSKFGSKVRSRNRTGQFNEVLCKVLCHNICVLIHEMHEMGIHNTHQTRLFVQD